MMMMVKYAKQSVKSIIRVSSRVNTKQIKIPIFIEFFNARKAADP